MVVYMYSVCDYPNSVLNHKFNMSTVQNPVGGGDFCWGEGAIPSLYETLIVQDL